jgi:hypothetical protein
MQVDNIASGKAPGLSALGVPIAAPLDTVFPLLPQA